MIEHLGKVSRARTEIGEKRVNRSVANFLCNNETGETVRHFKFDHGRL